LEELAAVQDQEETNYTLCGVLCTWISTFLVDCNDIIKWL